MIRGGVAAIVIAMALGCSSQAPPPEPPAHPRITRPDRALTPAEEIRFALYEELQPVRLSNCDFERIGDSYDGGYVLCANLIDRAEAFYSYGISGTDNWGCTLSARQKKPVHQYDCFVLNRPPCEGAAPVFHEECVGPSASMQDGRPFDTIEHQMEENGDAQKRVVMKLDVEGAEWESFLSTPDALFERVDQLNVEFHGIDDPRYPAVIKKLKQHFHVVNVHTNNYSCSADAYPLAGTAFEVLFVNKAVATVDTSRAAVVPNPLDAPNAPARQDCQFPADAPK